MMWFSTVCTAAAIALFAFGTPFGIWRGSTLFGGVFRQTALDLFFAGVLGITLLLGSSRFRWIVQRPMLRWFGAISYGLYLVQMLAFDFVDHWIARFFPGVLEKIPSDLGLMFLRFLASTGVAVGAAFVSRRYFEEWFLRLKDRWTPSAPSVRPNSQTVAIGRQPEERTA